MREKVKLLETLIAWIHILAWAVYLGGAIAMEFILRHAQSFMRGSQVAVVCQNSGRKYRWLSFVCLLLLLVTGLMRAGITESTESTEITETTLLYSFLLFSIVLIWVLLLGILGLLSFHIHPEMHLRVSPSMTEQEVTIERQRVGVAIRQMDIWVRIELLLALLATLAGAALRIV